LKLAHVLFFSHNLGSLEKFKMYIGKHSKRR